MEIKCIGTGAPFGFTKQDIASMRQFNKIIKNYLKLKMLKNEL